MFYTCYDPLRSPQGPEICQALSPHGLTWSYAASGDANVKGRVLPTGAGVWDTAHETSFILKRGANYYLYYVGYIDKGGILASFPSSIGFAYSTDGTNFVVTASPIIAGTPRGYDADMITSPSIVDIGGGQLMMLYAGFCYNNCLHATGPTLLGATSTDGLSWTKIATPIIKPTEIPWSNEGVAESEIVKGPDGFYYLFMTVLQGAKPHQLAVARSANYTGPWQVNPQPILPAGAVGAFDEGEDLAPSVLIENGKTRMWFHGVNKSKNAIAIGYAEASWPLFK